ncbi:MAG: hypothetical protein Q8K20_14705, partial [Gemmobacter sp.]|nr:hypothetical protein [Gemmobacter sp.]
MIHDPTQRGARHHVPRVDHAGRTLHHGGLRHRMAAHDMQVAIWPDKRAHEAQQVRITDLVAAEVCQVAADLFAAECDLTAAHCTGLDIGKPAVVPCRLFIEPVEDVTDFHLFLKTIQEHPSFPLTQVQLGILGRLDFHLDR